MTADLSYELLIGGREKKTGGCDVWDGRKKRALDLPLLLYDVYVSAVGYNITKIDRNPVRFVGV